jgi:hypothetical protein
MDRKEIFPVLNQDDWVKRIIGNLYHSNIYHI